MFCLWHTQSWAKKLHFHRFLVDLFPWSTRSKREILEKFLFPVEKEYFYLFKSFLDSKLLYLIRVLGTKI